MLVLRRAFSAPLRGAAITAALLAVLAATAAASTLSGSVGGAAGFPERSLVLSAPPAVTVSVPHLYVSENGKPVDDLSVTPLPASNPSDFGIVVVLDRNASMSGAPLAREMAAARAIAAQRSGRQELGVITFASAPSIVLPMTSDQWSIDHALSRAPLAGVGSDPLPALTAALKQLSYAHVAGGAVILLSDGATTTQSKLTAQGVATAAQAQHVQIYSLGVRDRSYAAAGLRHLAKLGGGSFATAGISRLPRDFTHLTSARPRSYLIGYRSILPGSEPVAVTVRLDGVSGLLHLSYTAPAPASSGASSGTASTSSGAQAPTAKPSTTKSSPTKSSTGKSSGALPSTSLPSGGKSTIPALPTSAKLPPAPTSHPTSGHHAKKASPAPRHPVPASTPPVTAATGWVPRSPSHSFWTSSLGLVAIAGGCALLIALAIVVLLYRPSRRALQQRVANFTLSSPSPVLDGAPLATNAGGGLSGLLTRRRWWPAFAQRVETARMRRSPLQLVRRWAVCSIVVAVIVTEVTGTVLFGILLLIVAPFVLRAVVSRGARRMQRAFSDQLPSHLQDLAGTMRAGRSFVGGISGMVETANEPIRGEFERALADERLGLPLEDTLEAIGRRMGAADMEQVALVAALNRSSGSNVAEALERVAESSRDRADLRREMRALTGQARMSAYVLTGMPPVMLLALMVIAPQYQRPLFHTLVGIILLVIAAGMLAAGWFVMSKICNPEV